MSPQPLPEIPVYVFAGGRSSRFGSDKARATYQGRTIVEHIAAALAPLGPVSVVTHPDRSFADLGLRTLHDRTPDRGPLSGLQVALEDADAQWIAVAPCDTLGLEASWYGSMLQRASGRAVCFEDGERSHPMVGLYQVALRSEVARRLGDGQLALWRIVDELGTRLTVPPGWDQLARIDTPADLEELCRRNPSFT